MNRIQELRVGLGLSVDDLADQIGTSGTQIRRLESGTRRLTTEWLERIAIALQCSPADLLVNVVVSAIQDDVVPATLSIKGVSAAIARRGLVTYRVTGVSLSAIGMMPGDMITVDETADAIASASDGDVVLVQVVSTSALMLRQYLRPGLLTTNTQGANTALHTNDRSIALKIVGVVIRD